jgi:dienelactone hydrolase
LQGTRDVLADVRLMRKLARRLGSRTTLKLFEDADHSFHVPARTGRKDAEIRSEMLDAVVGWLEEAVAATTPS